MIFFRATLFCVRSVEEKMDKTLSSDSKVGQTKSTRNVLASFFSDRRLNNVETLAGITVNELSQKSRKKRKK